MAVTEQAAWPISLIKGIERLMTSCSSSGTAIRPNFDTPDDDDDSD
jgi:hypothetical protein